MSNDEVFDALMRWGKLGHTSHLYYGGAGLWTCIIHPWSVGSVSFGSNEPLPAGYHLSNPYEAARAALKQAAQCWPEMAERAQL